MSDVTCDITVSLDGFVAGPTQSLDQPVDARATELVTHVTYRVLRS